MKLRRVILLGVVLSGVAVAAARPPAGKHAGFSPPTVTAAGDIPFPLDVVALGMVSLLMTLDNAGNVQNVQVLRDYPALTPIVRNAVQNWSFAPASRGQKSVPAVLSLSAVFNPYNPGGGTFQTLAVPSPAFTPAPASGGPAYIPPQIVSGAFALYPQNSVGAGAVVLEVRIDATGQVAKVRPIRSVASLTAPSITAVRSWGFSPATLDGQPVAGSLVIAFVYSTNPSQP
jgi:outer membrane biosynthesis protein TonB